MSTTSTERAADALDTFATLGIPFALLHGSNAMKRGGATSDIDLAVASPPALIVPRLARALPECDLHVIVRWNYDIGEATTLILSTHDASDGVQLDLLFDANGIGLDGVMTPWIIQQRDETERWPRANAVHELLYLIRKRHRKGDAAAVRALVERAQNEHPPHRLRVEAFKIFRGPVARAMCALLAGSNADLMVGRPAALRARLTRLGGRMIRPVGFWAECEIGDSDAHVRSVADAFGRFMPHSRCERRPVGRAASALWFAREVAPVRWRPGLILSTTKIRKTRIPQPDLVFARAAPASEIRTAIVAAMASRVIHAV